MGEEIIIDKNTSFIKKDKNIVYKGGKFDLTSSFSGKLVYVLLCHRKIEMSDHEIEKFLMR